METRVSEMIERFPALTIDVHEEIFEVETTGIQPLDDDFEARAIKEMQAQFPALSDELCKTMLELHATASQLEKRNESEAHKAFERVNSYIPTKDPPESPSEVLNLVLVGKTGVGKSQTANLIVGNGSFKASSSSKSVTQTVHVAQCKINGVLVRVVDTPGFIDTHKKEKDIATELLKVGLSLPEGIHAFIFLRNLGNPRNTPEEKMAFRLFVDVFTEEVLKHCVFVFTRAKEVLNMDDLQEKTIEGWLNQNVGGDEVYERVENRVVGVENVSASPVERKMQREKLISYIQDMIADTQTYDPEVFQNGKERNKKVVQKEFDKREEEGDEMKDYIRDAVNKHLMGKSRTELAKIAKCKGSFLHDIEEICKDEQLAGYNKTVKKLLKSFAETLVNKGLIGKVTYFAVGLFGFAIK